MSWLRGFSFGILAEEWLALFAIATLVHQLNSGGLSLSLLDLLRGGGPL